MAPKSLLSRWGYITVFLFIILATQRSSVASERLIISPAQSEAQKVTMAVGKSKLVNTPKPVNRVSVGNPEIADVLVTLSRQIHINAKAPGVTSIILWDRGGVSTFFDLEVCSDISGLKQELKEILPNENIRVNAAQDSVILSGTVSSAARLSTALSLAEPFVPKKVVNLMEVGGVQQVMMVRRQRSP
jgi:pilus assembly protein CpaC